MVAPRWIWLLGAGLLLALAAGSASPSDGEVCTATGEQQCAGSCCVHPSSGSPGRCFGFNSYAHYCDPGSSTVVLKGAGGAPCLNPDGNSPQPSAMCISGSCCGTECMHMGTGGHATEGFCEDGAVKTALPDGASCTSSPHCQSHGCCKDMSDDQASSRATI